MRALVARQVRTLGDIGIARGMRGNRAWFALGAVSFGLRALGRFRRRDEVIWRAELAPGEQLQISHLLDSFRELGEKPPR